MEELLTIKEASDFATRFLNRKISTSNISYLIQYGRVKKINENGETQIFKSDLLNYFEKSRQYNRKNEWQKKLGDDLNWNLSFDEYKESDTTKHVHRLHPYKGKFIPQLVEYFLDGKTDNFKKEIYFKKGDIILDPFCGSGTALVQASELGMHAIGIDISAFNSFISNVKLGNFDLGDVESEIKLITVELEKFVEKSKILNFENELANCLLEFNNKFFPSPDYKRQINEKKINEFKYASAKETEFLKIYFGLINKYQIKLEQGQCDDGKKFINKWYIDNIRNEIDFVFDLIKKIKNIETKKLLALILSRTVRSCRATTHADLATLKNPQTAAYYCAKHGKICKPVFSILNWWKRYSRDTFNRICNFKKIKTDTFQTCLSGDARNINIFNELKKINKNFAEKVAKNKIAGIFSSPPYVGLIDYHEQHAYAYEIFGFKRKDELEIGPLFKGQGLTAQDSYVAGVVEVLNNCKKYLPNNANIFLVANDKYGLYPRIAQLSGMKIINQYKRPVLNRTEKDKGAYSETIFHFKNI